MYATPRSTPGDRWLLAAAAILSLVPGSCVWRGATVGAWPIPSLVACAVCLVAVIATRRWARGIAVAALVWASVATVVLARPTLGERVTTADYDGIIVAGDGDPAWVPTRGDVQACESSLRQYLESRPDVAASWPVRHLHEYKRQYIGLAPARERALLIVFVHGSRAPDGRWLRWRNDGTVGGGAYYFRVVCDSRRRAFSGLAFNHDL